MPVDPVTPLPGTNAIVAVGGTPVVAVPALPAGINGCTITNPYLASDQGIVTAEPLYVNPVDAAGTQANDNTFALQPGGSWSGIRGQITATSVNAATSGHKFSVVYW